MSERYQFCVLVYYQMSGLFDGAVLAASYVKFRPQPPPSIISCVIDYVKESLLVADHQIDLNLAVDVGCGSGQVYKNS